MFEDEPGKRSGSKTFNVTYPNFCSLNHEGRDNLIRKMLVASGIEPQAPKDDGNADTE